MVKRSIVNRRVFEVLDGGRISYGFSQGWYKTGWQRTSGCGPTAVAGILHYLGARGEDSARITRQQALKRMEDVWQYVRPTIRGIPEAKMLYDGIIRFAKANALTVKPSMINIDPKKIGQTLMDSVRFIDNALIEDSPVAFLNLNRGGETKLDSWHWVIIVALEYEPDGSAAKIEFLDEGEVKRADFVNWYRTTSMGGGLVSVLE